MTERDDDCRHLTWPECIAGYVDCELDAAASSRVEAKLQVDAASREAVEAQRAFAPSNSLLWSRVEPPAPSADEWNRVKASVIAAAVPQYAAWRTSKTRLWRYLLAAIVAVPASVAAAVLLAMSIMHSPNGANSPDAGKEPNAEVFAVLAPHEVEIESVRNSDIPLLVVGESPFQGGVTFVSYTDVKVGPVQPDSDGMVPQVEIGNSTSTPMIYAPLARVP